MQAFRDAFSVVLATVVYLPSVNIMALVPLAGSVRQVGSGGALLDFDQEAGAVVLKADKYYVEGDVVRVCDSLSRPNGELLLSCGLVDDVRAPLAFASRSPLQSGVSTWGCLHARAGLVSPQIPVSCFSSRKLNVGLETRL